MRDVKKPRWRSLKKLPLAKALAIGFSEGSHRDRSNGMCVMEVAAWVAGEPHSDHPKCVSKVIGAFMRNWNDSLRSPAERKRLLGPLLKPTLKTAANDAVEECRARMCDDWMVRTFAPAWLELAGLKDEAASLRALPDLTTTQACVDAMPKLETARAKADAAWDAALVAAGDAARDAAWAAARVAARDAAWAAARVAAGVSARDAAWAAARVAAGVAARDAAWAAAWAAAGVAARDALSSTTKRLQKSAQQLVLAMCKVKESAK